MTLKIDSYRITANQRCAGGEQAVDVLAQGVQVAAFFLGVRRHDSHP